MIITRRLIREIILEEFQNKIEEGDTVFYNHPSEKEFRGKFTVRKTADNFLYIKSYTVSESGTDEDNCWGISCLDPNASVTRMVLTEKTIH